MIENRPINKVLITGITGSGGSYLAEYLLGAHPHVQIHGVTRWHSTTSHENVQQIAHRITLHECDLNDFSAIYQVLKKVEPDAIFHLASHAHVRASFVTPLSVLNNNIMGTANLLEAIRAVGIDPIIQLCSTSEVYGQVDPKDVPIKELCPMNPSSPYAVSKATQDLLGYTYYTSYNMKVIRTRMFAYINPRREDLFATSFAKQIARIEMGLQKELTHGNLDSVRTLIDVRDAMESYWIATTQATVGEVYNIGGAQTIRVGEFLEHLKKKARCTIQSKLDPQLLRPSDVTLQIPDTSKFAMETGWQPKYSYEESVDALLSFWRNKMKSLIAIK
ncbi:MAG: GDP-mannose 4,6-dehydratase [Deltaproteobacteria bacterium]|nr:GDP-mannose 4,6-dehydratase [Deltaproteobacteria bacterium]